MVCNCDRNDSEAIVSVYGPLMCVFIAGSAYAWGMGTNLQLGTGEEDDEWSPVEMTGKQLENRIVLMVASGGQHTILLVKDKQES